MSLTGTLEKGAHHQALDLSEELPPHSHNNHHHLHPHHHHNLQLQLQQANSLASTAPAGTPVSGSGVVVPPPYSLGEEGSGGRGGGSDAPLELRGSLDCWACSVLVTAQNLVIAAINACLAGVVFGVILTPAIVMVVFGFLCHSTVRPHGTSEYCVCASPAVVTAFETCWPRSDSWCVAAGGGLPAGHSAAGLKGWPPIMPGLQAPPSSWASASSPHSRRLQEPAIA
ncbi:hypothetical protein AALO_G00302320 [Alosa alosa]|uniref:Transmembrane protein 88 b n=1 Tax=Alosa alosa TaxID=278164 RepID=A0AAV6FLR7_9TELE|nr:hypothetical protein AALO_G00302320 [Alosa alosa]